MSIRLETRITKVHGTMRVDNTRNAVTWKKTTEEGRTHAHTYMNTYIHTHQHTYTLTQMHTHRY